MKYETVISERVKDGRVGIMTLNRPDKLNAWNRQLLDDMVNCLEEFKNDENMRVVVVKGAGKHFSAGMDFTEVLDKPLDVGRAFLRRCSNMREALHSMPQITIAAVRGTAAAFGTHLVWYCDLAVASENAFFGAPPINVGIG
jgi:enoyl-CoA hydratase/carnithine racemase